MNTNADNINDDMLVKYLLGEASQAEHEEVAAWIAAKDEHRKYFEHFRLIWDQSKELAAQSTVSTDEAWQRFVKRTEDDVQQSERRTIPLFQRALLRVAAVLVLCAGAGWMFYSNSNKANGMMMVKSGASTLTDTLPDGSVVVLNKNSSIEYPAKFEGNKRNVTLDGEAFFSVTPNKSKPFIIAANGAAITVVGTSFNVKSSAEATEVIVETGIVQVAKEQQYVRLKPNQKATVTAGKDAPEADTSTDELYNYYRTKEFVCKATPLNRLVAVLNNAYNAHIVIASEKAKNRTLTTTFKDEPLDNILKVIKETLGVTIEHNGEAIIIR